MSRPDAYAAGADEPITPLATKAISSDWLRVGDSHDVQGSFACPYTGRIHECSRIPHSQHEKISSGYLQEESIHEVLGGIVAATSEPTHDVRDKHGDCERHHDEKPEGNRNDWRTALA